MISMYQRPARGRRAPGGEAWALAGSPSLGRFLHSRVEWDVERRVGAATAAVVEAAVSTEPTRGCSALPIVRGPWWSGLSQRPADSRRRSSTATSESGSASAIARAGTESAATGVASARSGLRGMGPDLASLTAPSAARQDRTRFRPLDFGPLSGLRLQTAASALAQAKQDDRCFVERDER
jgi:hypothetical protein